MNMLFFRLLLETHPEKDVRLFRHLRRNPRGRILACKFTCHSHHLNHCYDSFVFSPSSTLFGMITTSAIFASTLSPSEQFIDDIFPDMGAVTSFCIFIASRINITCPSITSWPNVTSKVTIFPGILVETVPDFTFELPPPLLRLGAGATSSGNVTTNSAPETVARNFPSSLSSISTEKISPSISISYLSGINSPPGTS